MQAERKAINITIIRDGEKYLVETYVNEYRNLMVLLNSHLYLEAFGLCGGQGRCASCLIEIAGLQGSASGMERNEKVTIGKTGTGSSTSRLACQVLITADLNGGVIHLPPGYL